MTHFKLAFVGVLMALMSVFALTWHNKQVAKAEQAVHAHYAVVLAGINQKTAVAQAAFRAQEASWQTKFDEEARDGQRRVEDARRDTERARAERDRLRADLNGYRAAARAAAHSDAPGASEAAATAVDVLADLFVEADEVAGELAAALDLAHAAGVTCERVAGALGGGNSGTSASFSEGATRRALQADALNNGRESK